MHFIELDQAKKIFTAALNKYIKEGQDYWQKQAKVTKFFSNIIPEKNIPLALRETGEDSADAFLKKMANIKSIEKLIALTTEKEFTKGNKIPPILQDCIKAVTTDFSSMVRKEIEVAKTESQQFSSARISSVKKLPGEAQEEAKEQVLKNIVNHCTSKVRKDEKRMLL
jgi:hypothetical protein